MSKIRLRMGISRKKLSVARNDLIWFPKTIGESNVETTSKNDKEGRYLC